MTPKPTFDRLAPLYQTFEYLAYGPLLQRCRTAHLNRLLGCRRALVLGDGDGRFLAELLRANPRVRVDSLDISPGMLALARRRIAAIPGAAERVRFVRADARSTPLPDAGYDLIVTNFFLDCFGAPELESIITRVAGAALPDAQWLDGDFRLPAGRWSRTAARAVVSIMYLFFAIATRLPARRITDPAPFLMAKEFELASELRQLRGFLSSRLWIRKVPESI